MKTENSHWYFSKLKWFWLFSTVIILNRWFSGVTLTGWVYPKFSFDQSQVFYQWMTPAFFFVTNNSFAAGFLDMLWVILPTVLLVSSSRYIAWLLFVVTVIQVTVFSFFSGHYYHNLYGLIAIIIPFCASKKGRFETLWELVRFYWLFIFTSAALWKIARGTFLLPDHFVSILKSHHVDFLLYTKSGFQVDLIRYLLTHKIQAHLVYCSAILLQLSFVIGFFTKRFDCILFWGVVAFVVANYLLLRIVSADLLILNLTLVDWDALDSYLKHSRLKFLRKLIL